MRLAGVDHCLEQLAFGLRDLDQAQAVLERHVVVGDALEVVTSEVGKLPLASGRNWPAV